LIDKIAIMKNVLVLTDFSDNASAAAETGLLIAGKMHCGLVLYNTYINYQTITSYGGGAWNPDEFTERKFQSKKGLEALTEGLESLSYQLGPEDRVPAIYCESDDNDLGMDVADIIERKNVELVVMGARSDTRDDFMFGADTNAAIEYSTRPILITPAGTNLMNLHRIVFATDFGKADRRALHYMARLGRLLHYKIEIVHVVDPLNNFADEKEEQFKQLLDEINYTGLTYRRINGRDVIHRLNMLVARTPDTLLALVHAQNSFLVRIFEHSMVRTALRYQKTPLLVFPSKME
jgi:nucleotide-binding universal stress UspA family protein